MHKASTTIFITAFLILTSCSSPPNSPSHQQSFDPAPISVLQQQKEEALSQAKQSQETLLSLQREHERTLMESKKVTEELSQVQKEKDSAEQSAVTATTESNFLKGVTVAVGVSALVIGAGIGSRAKNESKKGGTTKNGKKSSDSTGNRQ